MTGLPFASLADVPTVVASTGDSSVHEAPGTEHTADVETEETEVEGEMAGSSVEEDGDGDDGFEEAYAAVATVAIGSPPAVKLLPEERSPSTQACVRRHPRPAEAV